MGLVNKGAYLKWCVVTTNRRTSYDGVWLPKTLVNTVTVNRSLTSYDEVWLM